MWLRLTAYNETIILVNSDNIVGLMIQEDKTVLIDVNNKQSHIKESIDEIEIMLAGKGAEVRLAGRERDFIGKNPAMDWGGGQ